jgi:hypothetical protein
MRNRVRSRHQQPSILVNVISTASDCSAFRKDGYRRQTAVFTTRTTMSSAAVWSIELRKVSRTKAYVTTFREYPADRVLGLLIMSLARLALVPCSCLRLGFEVCMVAPQGGSGLRSSLVGRMKNRVRFHHQRRLILSASDSRFSPVEWSLDQPSWLLVPLPCHQQP